MLAKDMTQRKSGSKHKDRNKHGVDKEWKCQDTWHRMRKVETYLR